MATGWKGVEGCGRVSEGCGRVWAPRMEGCGRLGPVRSAGATWRRDEGVGREQPESFTARPIEPEVHHNLEGAELTARPDHARAGDVRGGLGESREGLVAVLGRARHQPDQQPARRGGGPRERPSGEKVAEGEDAPADRPLVVNGLVVEKEEAKV